MAFQGYTLGIHNVNSTPLLPAIPAAATATSGLVLVVIQNAAYTLVQSEAAWTLVHNELSSASNVRMLVYKASGDAPQPSFTHASGNATVTRFLMMAASGRNLSALISALTVAKIHDDSATAMSAASVNAALGDDVFTVWFDQNAAIVNGTEPANFAFVSPLSVGYGNVGATADDRLALIKRDDAPAGATGSAATITGNWYTERMALTVAMAKAASTPTISRPIAGSGAGTGWTASAGADLSAMVNEVVASDAEYIRDNPNSATPYETAITPPRPAGVVVVRHRGRNIVAGKRVRVHALSAAGAVVGSGPWHEMTAVSALYESSISTTGETARLRFETAVIPAAGLELGVARLLIEGHSLTDNPLPDNVALIAQSKAKTIQWNQQNTPGAPIRLHTKGVDVNVTGWPGYSTGKNRAGTGAGGGNTGLDILAELTTPQTITGGKYDTLILCERHDLLDTLRYEDTVRYARHYHERLHEGLAAAKTYIYHAWMEVFNKANPTDWIAYERAMAMPWQGIASRINVSLIAEGRTDRVDYLPAGLALADLVEQATTGNVAGVTGANVQATMDALFADNVHLTVLGGYFMACVVYASVYRASPIGADYPAGVTAQQAAALQQVAWSSVTGYYTAQVLPDLATVRSSATSWVTAYRNYREQWLPGQAALISSDVAFFGSNS